MTRLAILGFLIVLLILLVRTFFPSPKKEKVSEATDMIKDPNCETYVPKSEAILKTIGGQDHYFCSEKCAEEFGQKNG